MLELVRRISERNVSERYHQQWSVYRINEEKCGLKNINGPSKDQGLVMENRKYIANRYIPLAWNKKVAGRPAGWTRRVTIIRL